MTIQALRQACAAGATSPAAEVESALARIAARRDLNAFISVFPEEARARAQAVSARLATGCAGPLAGLVLAVKDLICIRGLLTTCGSRLLSTVRPPYSATVIDRLEAADAIIIGKTNMDEYAMGSTTETSSFGPTVNPHDRTRTAGGSSGGSAAAVAAGLVPAALGSDTGGSIRQPAAFCGVVGLKPTYGRVSRYGLVAYASSLDQIGPITTSVADAAVLLQVIAGHDPRDSTSVDVPLTPYTEALGHPITGLRIGVPLEYTSNGLDPEVGARLEALTGQLREHGAVVEPMSLPRTEYCVAAYYVLAPAEASSNLARFDGVRYGVRDDTGDTLEELYARSRSAGFGAEVKRRIMLGTYVLSAGYYDAYYQKARKVRRLIKEDFDRAFHSCDCLLTPVAPTTAFRLGEKLTNPLQMYLSDIYTVSANLAGIPGLAVPFGRSRNGLPIGFQILGRHFDESTLLRVGHHIETECVPPAEA